MRRTSKGQREVFNVSLTRHTLLTLVIQIHSLIQRRARICNLIVLKNIERIQRSDCRHDALSDILTERDDRTQARTSDGR